MKAKKAALIIAYLLIALGALAAISLIFIPAEKRSDIILSLCTELLGAALVFVVLERFMGSDDHPFDMARRSSAVVVKNLGESVEELSRTVDEKLYVIDTYTHLEDQLTALIARRLKASKKLEVVIILLDPRSPLLELRAPCLDLSLEQMRNRVAQCLTKFLRSRKKLPENRRQQVTILAYRGILGVAAIRFDETIIFAHYLRGESTGNATWMDVRHGQSLFDRLAGHFDEIIKSDLVVELRDEDQVHEMLKEAVRRDDAWRSIPAFPGGFLPRPS